MVLNLCFELGLLTDILRRMKIKEKKQVHSLTTEKYTCKHILIYTLTDMSMHKNKHKHLFQLMRVHTQMQTKRNINMKTQKR